MPAEKATSATRPHPLVPEDPSQHPLLYQYFVKVRSWHGYIRFLGLPRLEDNLDIPISQLFVEPFIAEQSVSPDMDPKEWPRAQSALVAVADHPRLVLLGDPGSGKSTLVSWIAFNLAQSPVNPWIERLGRLVPLPMVLREMKIERGIRWDGLLDAFLNHQMAQPLRAEGGRALVEALLAEGRAFPLLDGLDELGSVALRRDVHDAVLQGMRLYPQSRFLLTSRIVGYEEVPFDIILVRVVGREARERGVRPLLEETRREARMADRAYVAPFTDAQVEEFAANWFRRREAAEAVAIGQAREFVARVRADRATTRLARVPNLLTMMALIYRIRAKLPNGRALLYDQIAQAYLETIDQYRKLLVTSETLAEKKSWLARVGFEMQKRRSPERDRAGEILATSAEVRDWIAEAMSEMGRAGTEEAANEFVDYIARRSGLLLPRGEDRFAFTHLSFQEYFAACHLVARVVNPAFLLPASQEEIRAYAAAAVWRESMLFLFELLAIEPKDRPWLSCLSDALFGKGFAAIGPRKRDHPVTAGLAALLARLAVDPYSGVSEAQRPQAFGACWRFFCGESLRLAGRLWLLDPEVARTLFAAEEDYRPAVRKELALAAQGLNVTGLNMTGAPVADADLDALRGLKGLQWLALSGTQVTDAGLDALRGLKGLQWLALSGTQVTDAGLDALRELKELRTLWLGGTPVTDAGLDALRELKGLQQLDLSGTQVTDAGRARLKKALPKCRIS